VTLNDGQNFGRYRIIDQLGRGGMATVFKAYEPGLDRHIALKILPAEFLHESTFAERFQREAKTIARLEHRHIVPIYAFGIDDGIPWMAMRLVPGGSLSDVLKRGRPDQQRVIAILTEVAEALGYAHEEGVLHRDVKPQNVLLDATGHVYLADFGIARMVEGSAHLTKTGMITGTPQYMAPEQAQGGTLDHRCDIYALGIMVYEMLTGSVPFSADTPVAVLMKHLNDPIPLPSREDVPEALLLPVLKALAKDRKDRWDSAEAFASALRGGLAEAPGQARPSPPAPTRVPTDDHLATTTEPAVPLRTETTQDRGPAPKPPGWVRRAFLRWADNPRAAGGWALIALPFAAVLAFWFVPAGPPGRRALAAILGICALVVYASFAQWARQTWRRDRVRAFQGAVLVLTPPTMAAIVLEVGWRTYLGLVTAVSLAPVAAEMAVRLFRRSAGQEGLGSDLSPDEAFLRRRPLRRLSVGLLVAAVVLLVALMSSIVSPGLASSTTGRLPLLAAALLSMSLGWAVRRRAWMCPSCHRAVSARRLGRRACEHCGVALVSGWTPAGADEQQAFAPRLIRLTWSDTIARGVATVVVALGVVLPAVIKQEQYIVFLGLSAIVTTLVFLPCVVHRVIESRCPACRAMVGARQKPLFCHRCGARLS